MTPGLRHLPAPNAAFEFPNEALSFSVPSVRVCMRMCMLFFPPPFVFNHRTALLCVNTTYILMLGAQRRLWLMRL